LVVGRQHLPRLVAFVLCVACVCSFVCLFLVGVHIKSSACTSPMIDFLICSIHQFAFSWLCLLFFGCVELASCVFVWCSSFVFSFNVVFASLLPGSFFRVLSIVVVFSFRQSPCRVFCLLVCLLVLLFPCVSLACLHGFFVCNLASAIGVKRVICSFARLLLHGCCCMCLQRFLCVFDMIVG